MHLPKKIVLFFFLFLFSFITLIVSAKSVSAAEDIITPYPTVTVYPQKNPQDVFMPTFGEMMQEKKSMYKKAAKTNQYQLSGLPTTERHANDTLFTLTEMIICPDEEICGNRPTALGTVTNLIAAVYTNPLASGVYYAYDLLHNAGLAKPALAQGIGFAGLTPLLSIWKVTRNIAYSVLIIIIVAIGFMIIFRMKIDPKTVISFQAALPKIILALILITFSYPIVGFLIDLMYLSMAIVVHLLANGMGPSFSSQTTQWQAQMMTADAGVLAGWIFNHFGRDSWNLITGLLWPVPTGIQGIVDMIAWWGKFITSKPGLLFFSSAIPLILTFIVFLGLLFTFIRLLILLFNSYIQVLISLLLGPIILLAEAIPGKSAFGGWIGNLIANLIVFPTTVAILMFSMFLSSLPNTNLWIPPFVAIPVLGAGGGVFNTFLGLGVIFLAPGLVASVKKLFKPQPIVPLTPGTMLAPLTGSFQTTMGAASQFYYVSQLRGMLPGSQQRHQQGS